MAVSHLETMSVAELMALIFLIEENKPIDEASLKENTEFMKKWQTRASQLRKLIEYYPDEDEEKHYLIAVIDAVLGIDPYSEEALKLKTNFHSIISKLIKT